MVRQVIARMKLFIPPLLALGLIWGGISQWTLGFQAFTTYGYVFAASKPLPKSPPPFILLTQEGQTFALNQLKGKFYLLNLAFLGCSQSCPISSEAFKQLDTQITLLGVNDLSLLTLTINPEEDSSQALKQAWLQLGAPKHWIFASPQGLSINAYWAALEDMGGWVDYSPEGQIIHDSRTFLLSPEGQLIASFEGVPSWETLRVEMQRGWL